MWLSSSREEVGDVLRAPSRLRPSADVFQGIMYFLLNYREKVQSDIRGAGVAEVSIQPDHTGRPIPHARRLNKWLWDGQKEPWYGDVCAVDFQGHIYALGHKTDSPFMYIARVPRTEPFNIDAYEYWNGTSWQRERLDGPALGEKESIMWQCGQGQVFWSEFHNRLLFVYCDCWWTDQVLVSVPDFRSRSTDTDLCVSRFGTPANQKVRGLSPRLCTNQSVRDLTDRYIVPYLTRTSTQVARLWSLLTPTCLQSFKRSKS